MRAEAHYVDLLASRSATRERTLPISAIEDPACADHTAIASLVESIRQHGVLQPLLIQDRDGSYQLIAGRKRLAAAAAAGLREVPCVIYDVDDEHAEALVDASNVLALQDAHAAPLASPVVDTPAIPDPTLHAGRDLAHSLTTLTACADMLGGAQSDLARTVVANLIRAEAWRASSLLQATRVIRQELTIVRTAVPAQAILDRAVRALDADRQVRHLLVDVASDLARGTCLAADETLLASALGWAGVATLALLDGVHDARLSFGAAGSADGRIVFTVSQDAVAVPDAWAARAFDPAWTERPGGVPAVVSLLALARAAAAHHGSVAVEVTSRGTRITLSIPLGT
jgi:ParB-like chromosome segregation protein Spo0J